MGARHSQEARCLPTGTPASNFAILMSIVIQAPTSSWLGEMLGVTEKIYNKNLGSQRTSISGRIDTPNTNLGEGRRGLSV